MKDNKKKKKNVPFNSLENTLQQKMAAEKKLLGQDLGNEERTVLDCFRKSRLILDRIQIIYNQSRQAMGMPLKSQKELREILGSLADKEYITIESFDYAGQQKEAFILTEQGKQLV